MTGQHQLIIECLKGNRIAQKQLYEEYASSMLGLCVRYTKNLTEAEDVLQDAFVKVFTRLHQYKGEGELGAWIRRVVVNTAITHLKKNRPLTEMMSDEVDQEPIATDPHIMSSLSAKDLVNLIRSLPDGYQLVFNLFAIEGFTHEEIGNLLGIRPASSRSQFLRARTWLAKKIVMMESMKDKVMENG